MKAVITKAYGGPDQMELTDVPEPQLLNRDVRVQVHAASINPVDWKFREGHLKRAYKVTFPWILGQDVAGVVTEVGMRARNLKVGDRVYARVNHLKMGTICEEVTVEKTDIAKMPESLSFEEAASIPLVGLTSWQVLVEIMKVKNGDSIFIHAGSGGVGTFAIQLAKHLGAKVTSTSSAANHDLLRELGADEVIDYHEQDYTDLGPKFDHVFAIRGGEDLMKSFKLAKPQGTVVGITGLPDDTYAKSAGFGFFTRQFLKYANRDVTSAAAQAQAQYRFHALSCSEAQLRRIAALVDEGAIKPVVDSVFSMQDYAAAFAKLEEGHARGKIVIRVRDEASAE